MTELEKVEALAALLIEKLCLNTNATEAVYTVKGLSFKKSGKKLGDWQITIESL